MINKAATASRWLGSLNGKVAIVLGASRGIGKEIALTFAKAGASVCVASKTAVQTDKLPGSIFSVAEEINKLGRKSLPIQCDVRDPKQIDNVVQQTIKSFGKVDILVYNAGAVWWNKIANTPLKKFDLLHEVNVHGCYAAVESVMPHMMMRKSGHIIVVSPPIYSRFFKGKVAYSISKVGMTILAMGLGEELKAENSGISINALWPATAIESHVTELMKLGDPTVWRKPAIFADACLGIVQENPNVLNGEALIDEDFLRSKGIENFTEYRCSPNDEPPRMMPKKFPSLKVEEETVLSKL